jgi:phospholipid/cholesterol/gamma-HCH transport system substrate-binding protein
MKKFDLELSVGIFLLIGIFCLGYLSIKLARMEILGEGGYDIHAAFTNVGGLKKGASVVIAGVEVGRVKSIAMVDYEAKVILTLPNTLEIQEDAIASIKTKGLIGEKFIQITPGGADEILKSGDRIRDTLPALDVEELISKFVFGKI